MLVMTARRGLKRSIHDSASLTLKWLGCARIAQPVDDPEIEVFQKRPALGRDVADIRRIGGVANPVSKRRDVAVLHDERRKRHRSPLPFDGATFARFDIVTVQDRRIVAAGGRRKAVRKPQHDVACGRLVQVDRNTPALME